MTRRLLLVGLFVSLWRGVAQATERLAAPLQPAARGRVARESKQGRTTASAAEMASLLAFGEVVVAGHPLPPAEREYLVEFIQQSCRENREQLVEYRRAARLLDTLAGRPFSHLEIDDRSDLVSRHHLDRRGALPGREPEPFAQGARLIRTRVVPELIAGYWASPAGWAAVGYDVFPGRCGDLARYTRPAP